jgi:hypothetical protein
MSRYREGTGHSAIFRKVRHQPFVGASRGFGSVSAHPTEPCGPVCGEICKAVARILCPLRPCETPNLSHGRRSLSPEQCQGQGSLEQHRLCPPSFFSLGLLLDGSATLIPTVRIVAWGSRGTSLGMPLSEEGRHAFAEGPRPPERRLTCSTKKTRHTTQIAGIRLVKPGGLEVSYVCQRE